VPLLLSIPLLMLRVYLFSMNTSRFSEVSHNPSLVPCPPPSRTQHSTHVATPFLKPHFFIACPQAGISGQAQKGHDADDFSAQTRLIINLVLYFMVTSLVLWRYFSL
jgi:hypothetical protein